MEVLILLLIVVVLGIALVSVTGFAVNVVWALAIGALVGFIANWIVSYFRPAGGPQGFLSTALAGIGGSFLATLVTGDHGIVASIIGAMVVVFAWKAATTNSGRYATGRH